MANSFVMAGFKAGFDMTTQEGAEAFRQAYNQRRLEGRASPTPLNERPHDLSFPIPPASLSEFLTPKQRAEKRKANKAKRQTRKHNRRK
jgi:hypothetical protein